MRLLPRVKASPAFTSDVLRAVRRQDDVRQTPFVWRLAAGFAMALCLVAIVHVATLQYERRERMALRAERERIEAELADVKKIASEAEPVVVLENDNGTRVIMDLDSAIQPASLKTYD
jgi:hypothetical protein